MKKSFKTFLSVLICALLLVSAVTPAFAAIGKVKSLTLSAVTPTSATLQWKKVANAKGYEIQRYQSSQWKRVATTSSTSYTVKGLKLGTTYKFRVRAYSSAYGAFSSTLSVKTGPSSVKGFKAVSKTVSSIKLTWKKGADATGYRIQQYINKEWVTVVKSSKKTTATIKNVTPGKANKFKIAALKKVNGKTYVGLYSSVLSVKAPALSKPTALKTVSATDTSVTLTWKAVPGATSYNIYTVNGDTQKVVAKPTSNLCTVTGLKAATDYTFSVRTVLKGSTKTSYSPFSDKLSVRTAPAKVTVFNVPTSSEDAITLSWKAVTGAEGYEIWQYSSATSIWNLIGTSSRASYTVFGLASLTSYKFKVRPYHTVNGSKLYGAFSNETTASTSAGSVSDFTFDEVTSTSIKLSWKTVPNAMRYKVEIIAGGATVTSVTAAQNEAADSITTTVSGLSPYTRYTVRVSSVFTGSQSIPAEKSVITAPAKVTGFSGKAAYGGVELTWSAAAGAVMYEISQFSTLTSSWVLVASTSNTSYTVSGLPADSTYMFRVRAYLTNSSLRCYGPYSDTATVTTTDVPVVPPTPTKPSAPSLVSALDTSSGTSYSIKVSWSSVSEAAGYEVYDGSGAFIDSTTSTSCTLTGLSASTVYSFKVKAYVNSGSGRIYSDYSQTASAKTADAPVTPPTPDKLSAPTGVSATNTSSGTSYSIRVSWQTVSGADGYEVTTNNGSANFINNVTTTSYNAANLSASMTYTFKIRAYKTSGSEKIYSDYSQTASATTSGSPDTPPTPGKLSAPTGVSATNTSSGTSYSIRVSWQTVSGADGYEVTTNNGSANFINKVTATSYTAANLSASTTYTFKVRAYTSSGTYSDYSQTVTATTSGTPVTPPDNPPVNPPAAAGSAIPASYIDKNTPALTKATSTAISGLSVSLDQFGKGYTVTWTNISNAAYHVEYWDASQNKWVTLTNNKFLARLNIDLEEGSFGAKCENASDNVSKITWSPVSGATGYEVRNEIAKNTNAWSTAISKTSTSSDLRLAPNAEQTVRISALGNVRFRIYALDIATETAQLACSEYTPKVYIGYQDLTFKTPSAGTLSQSSSAGLKEAYTLMLVQAINNTRYEKSTVTLHEVSSMRTEVSAENISASIGFGILAVPVTVTDDMLEGLAPSEDREMTCTYSSGYGTATVKSTVDNKAPTTSERSSLLYSAITPFTGNYLYDQHNISSFSNGVKSVTATAGSNGSYTVTVVLNQEKVTATNLPKYHPGFCDSIANSADSLAQFGNSASATVGETTITAKINRNYTLDSLEIISPFSVQFSISEAGMNMSGTLPGSSHLNYQFAR